MLTKIIIALSALASAHALATPGPLGMVCFL